MLKGWAAWSRWIRWTAGGIAAVVLGLVIAWALLVPVADRLAHHDVGSAAGPLHETALDNARGRLLTLGAGLLAAGALAFTARTFHLSREGQVTDRYTKAIEQLGSEKLDIRIGGIYALERIARDSARDHPVVMEVLTAFIREHCREPWQRLPDPSGRAWERTARPDVQAAITVVGRRDAKRDIRRTNLSGVDLSGADLYGADFSRAQLYGVTFTNADLAHARLDGAALNHAALRADIMGATLRSADLRLADLDGATLMGADLSGADLSGTDLGRAILADANLFRADLSHADLSHADLSRADLTGANLAGARWSEDAPPPEGWELDADSGRLRRAGAGPRAAEEGSS